MGKKRKHSETQAAAAAAAEAEAKKNDVAPERPKRTLLGWKTKPQEEDGEEKENCDAVHAPVFRNKEKVLITCSRRINFRYRHLMLNVASLLPHSKRDSKVESKESKGSTLNELVELKNCSSCMFFECRKHKDLYLWMAKSPDGPSVKFLVNAVHTMEELKLTGNHLKGSRPLLTFSANFDKEPHWMLLKELMLQITVPHNEPTKMDRGGLDKMTLTEVGPRFCLNPIKIFGGSFGGPTLYENPFYISPNQIRSLQKKKTAGKYVKKVKAKTRRKMHELSNPMERDELADMWKE
ncbi:ribosome biogenesis protein BRX1 homolog 1-like isoform X2 [Chenopodium quinoa]|uniref:ribosome biogenesis protein BRX1 homolog 1-like isoform X2 n=1 Tax=Chenopodium quinoa TaxID=63459 RepID=UPI000B778DFA|nr:ribosome biogenesis protein BRX1 homolog 1-like isoform X2 [Chenopodium quinoa]